MVRASLVSPSTTWQDSTCLHSRSAPFQEVEELNPDLCYMGSIAGISTIYLPNKCRASNMLLKHRTYTYTYR